MRPRVAKSGAVHIQHSMFPPTKAEQAEQPRAEAEPSPQPDLPPARHVTYVQAYELMLDALRTASDPWETEAELANGLRVPLYTCQIPDGPRLSSALYYARIDREYEVEQSALQEADELQFTDTWSM